MEADSQTPVALTPRIGDKAPAFKAVTTQGEISFPDQYAKANCKLVGLSIDGLYSLIA